MLRSYLKVSLLVGLVSLYMCVPIVGAESVMLDWTSTTTSWLRSIYMVSADDGWAAGDGGTIIRWNGTDWSNVTSPIPSSWSIRDIDMVSANEGWACAGLVYYWNGVSWSQVWTPTGVWESASMLSADDGWAVGHFYQQGLIMHWNGASWSNVTSPTDELLMSVFMVSADDGWAVGRAGTIIHWDGSTWSNVGSPTTDWLFSVFIVGPDDGWAVGANGRIIRWTGIEWIPEFPAGIFTPLLIGVTVVAVMLAKTCSKKPRKPSL